MLNVTAINNAKPKEKQYKLTDSGGLYLLIMPTGSKLWRLKYYYMTREKCLSLGKYPTVSLADARKARDRAKELLAQGIDPSEARQDSLRAMDEQENDTFEAIANEWLANKTGEWSGSHAESVRIRLQADILPTLGQRPINAITAPETLEALREIEKRGANEMACRQLQRVRQIFDYAIATGRRKDGMNPASSLLVAMKGYKRNHYAALAIEDTGEFLGKIRVDRRLTPSTARATELLLLTFVRTGELIKAKKAEFDLEAGVWHIPADRMKMRRDHIVPLSASAVALLKEQFADFPHSEYVFPARTDYRKHMSNNTILYAIARAGFKGDTTGHGFRATARTAIREKLGYQSEIIEKQLAHKSSGPLGEAYDRTQFLPERRKMMQDWADYLEGLTSGSIAKLAA